MRALEDCEEENTDLRDWFLEHAHLGVFTGTVGAQREVVYAWSFMGGMEGGPLITSTAYRERWHTSVSP